MQNFIKPSGPGVKLKAEFEKINRDIVINLFFLNA